MTIKQLPEKYKIYVIELSSKKEFCVNGEDIQKILSSKSNLIALTDGSGFNKAFMVTWMLNYDKTKENVEKNKSEILLLGDQKLLN